jgi:predicted  nucleic acid-binding Zn-ribbon protein
MKLLLILPLLALASCATRTAVTAPLPAPPPKAAAVAPEVSRIRESIADADQQATAIRHAAQESTRAAADARKESGRLAGKGSATPAELNSLWKALQSLEARNLFLEGETHRLTGQLTTLRTSAASLEEKAAARDAEATQLRDQNIHLSARVTTSDRMTATAQGDAIQQRTRADKLAGEIRLYRIALGIFAALLIGWLALKFLLPLR